MSVNPAAPNPSAAVPRAMLLQQQAKLQGLMAQLRAAQVQFPSNPQLQQMAQQYQQRFRQVQQALSGAPVQQATYDPARFGGMSFEQFRSLPPQQRQSMKQQAGYPLHTSFGGEDGPSAPASPAAGQMYAQDMVTLPSGQVVPRSQALQSGQPFQTGAGAQQQFAGQQPAAAAPGGVPAPNQQRFAAYTGPMGNYGEVAASLTPEGLQQQIQRLIQGASNEVAVSTVRALRGADPNDRWGQGTAQTGLAAYRAKIDMLNAQLAQRGLPTIPIPSTFGDPAYASANVLAMLPTLRAHSPQAGTPLPAWATSGAGGAGATPVSNTSAVQQIGGPLTLNTRAPDGTVTSAVQEPVGRSAIPADWANTQGWSDQDRSALAAMASLYYTGAQKLQPGSLEREDPSNLAAMQAGFRRIGGDPGRFMRQYSASRPSQGSATLA